MKQENIIGIILIVFLFALFITTNLNINDTRRVLKNKIDLLQNDIKKKTKHDSLLIEHYNKCSFISSDELEIGYGGYIRVKQMTYKLK